MTDPTPKAPDAVPEAVSTAMSAYSHAVIVNEHAQLSEHSSRRERDDLSDARLDAWNELVVAIATALRQATETRDQEIARLREECQRHSDATESAWVNGLADASRMERAMQEIARLTAELAAAQADTARLDFLERTSANLFSWRTERVTGPARFSYCNGYQGATPRAAIDAARAAEDEP